MLRRYATAPIPAYLNNVVKHFKCEPRGKRRIHAALAAAAKAGRATSP